MKISIKIHYLFYIVACLYLITGNFYYFAVCLCCDIIHEIGHSIVAENYGVRLGKIILMPYGAVVVGSTEGLNLKDDIAISFAGPLLNLFFAIIFVAFWWVIPESYALTKIVVDANLSLCFVNLLPCYTLDGGRVLTCVVEKKYGEEKAVKIVKAVSLFFAVGLIILFVISCFEKINFTTLFFGCYLLFAVMTKDEKCKYLKLSQFLQRKLKEGTYVNAIAVNEDAILKNVIKKLDTRSFNVLYVYKKDKVFKIYNQFEIIEFCNKISLYDEIKKAF